MNEIQKVSFIIVLKSIKCLEIIPRRDVQNSQNYTERFKKGYK